MSEIPSKHWTEFLPWVGNPLLRQGYRQIDRLNQIHRKQLEMNSILKDIEEEEKEIILIALTEWTTEEIEEAKSKGLKS